MVEKAEEWRLSTADFAMLWAEQGGLEFPEELVPAQPTSSDGETTDYRGRRIDVGAEERRALVAFTRPRGSVTVLGIDASRDFGDPLHHVRMVAAWSGPAHAYLARQSLGVTIGTAGTVAITRHRIADIMRAVAGYLPTATRAGRLPYDAAVRFTERALAGNQMIHDVVDDETGGASAVFGPDVKVGHCGTISFTAGSITDGFAPTRLQVRYRDVIGDGRYVLVVDRPGYAAGVDDRKLARVLTNAVEVNRSRHAAAVDERAEDGW